MKLYLTLAAFTALTLLGLAEFCRLFLQFTETGILP